VVQSTVTLNQASQGGGVYNGGTAVVQNTIVAGDTATGAGQDVRGAFSTTSAYNAIGIVNDSTGLGDDPHTRAGTTGSPLNAGLAPLANNGGLTLTQMPSSLSPAVDHGSNALAVNAAGSPLTYDQRGVGYPRIIGSSVDVGSVEYLPTPSANAPPTIGSLSVSAAVAKQGQTITLTANNVADDHGVASVSFYLDSNHNGVGDPTELLGTSTSGWTWTGAVTWGTGLQTYLAIATDDGYPAGGPLTSAWASVTNTVVATTSPQITLGTYSLNANQSGQRIPIYVTGLDQVTGFNLDAQIVGSSAPKFQSIDFTGGIWDAHPTTVGGGPVAGSPQYAQASVIFTNSGDQTQANGLLCTLVVDTTGYAAGQSFALKLAGSGIGADSSFVLYGGAVDPATVTNGSIQLSQASVVGRYIVYNDSAWDGNGDAVSTADDNAIAPDKEALLPTQTATFANYTSYSRGINEIMIDIANLAATPTLTNFGFKVGNTTSPSSWPSAPTPTSFNVWTGGGTAGSTRMVITWADDAIAGEWLQVDVKAAGLGMAQDDVFYFGNARGESGNSATNAFVDGSDIAAARDNFTGFPNKASITNPYDYNRDQFVDGSDMAIARDNATNFLTALKLITAPTLSSSLAHGPAGSAAAGSSPAGGGSAGNAAAGSSPASGGSAGSSPANGGLAGSAAAGSSPASGGSAGNAAAGSSPASGGSAGSSPANGGLAGSAAAGSNPANGSAAAGSSPANGGLAGSAPAGSSPASGGSAGSSPASGGSAGSSPASGGSAGTAPASGGSAGTAAPGSRPASGIAMLPAASGNVAHATDPRAVSPISPSAASAPVTTTPYFLNVQDVAVGLVARNHAQVAQFDDIIGEVSGLICAAQRGLAAVPRNSSVACVRQAIVTLAVLPLLLSVPTAEKSVPCAPPEIAVALPAATLE
jgi:hypothetical protein